MKRNDAIAIIVCLVTFAITVAGVYWLKATNASIVAPGLGADWIQFYQPATQQLIAGGDIFSVEGYFNPPWTLIPLLPLAKLSTAAGVSIVFTVNLFVYIWVAWRMKMNKFALLPFVIFSGVLWNSYIGNIDGIVALGLILPRPLGLFFLSMKPQAGAPVAIVWLVDEWMRGGIKQALRTFLPVALAGLFTLLVYGDWFTTANQAISFDWNTSPWPYGIPIGIVFLALAIKNRDIRLALASTPFLTPYLTLHTWSFMWLGLLTLDWKQIILQVRGKFGGQGSSVSKST